MSARAKVLIVDDEPSFCKVIHTILRGDDYEVCSVGCGNEALGLIDTSPAFDVVLLDLNLPDMNGFKVMGHLSKQTPDTLVVIMTGYASLVSATEALRCGAYDYLTKPFAREELLKTLHNAMNHRKVMAAHRQTQQALENSERCFRRLVENILSGILIVRHGKLLYQNAIQKELFGPITEAVLSCNYDLMSPDDAGKLKEISEIFKSEEISKAETDFRFFVPSGAGDQAPLRRVFSRISRISYRGEVAIMVNTMDISSLKASERHAIRSLAGMSPG